LLKAFHKWWISAKKKRNSPKFTDAKIADLKSWWSSKKRFAPVNLYRIKNLYNRKINTKRALVAFLKYWKNSGITRKPYIYDVKAWWRRVSKSTRVKKPHFRVLIRLVHAKLAARVFKAGWEAAKKKTFPAHSDVKSWARTVGKSWRAPCKVIWRFVRVMFLLEKKLRPNRILRTYPELRAVHNELIKLHMKKDRSHRTIVVHLEKTRRAYLEAGSNLKHYEEEYKKDRKDLKLKKLALDFQRPITQKAHRDWVIARQNHQRSSFRYHQAVKMFNLKKKQYFVGTAQRRKRYLALEAKLKALRLLISLVGPQHHIRVMRECEVKKIGKRCSQRICCNVRYLADLKGKRRLGKEFCQLKGAPQCQ